jgi:hypothetical protein
MIIGLLICLNRILEIYIIKRIFSFIITCYNCMRTYKVNNILKVDDIFATRIWNLHLIYTIPRLKYSITSCWMNTRGGIKETVVARRVLSGLTTELEEDAKAKDDEENEDNEE